MPALRRLRPGPLWLALPGLAFLAVFFLVPVLQLLSLSIRDADGVLSPVQFARILETDVYVRVLLITFRIAALTALLSLLLGYPVAYWLARQPEPRRGW
jgi:ABC-type spermidine/putrescine transport system permease subunit I